MVIEYKKPYWIKYMWYIDIGVESNLLKKDNLELQNILFAEKYSFICDFKIDDNFVKDEKAGIFGKPGQNFGLNFDSTIDSLVFEFRTNNEVPQFHCIIFDTIKFVDIRKGIKMIITKNKNIFNFFVDGKLIKKYKYDDELIDEYKNSPFFLGSLNPGATNPKDRCYTQINFTLFSIIKNETNIKKLLQISNKDKNVLCYYDFKEINLAKNVCDESNNYNFIELVPKEFVL